MKNLYTTILCISLTSSFANGSQNDYWNDANKSWYSFAYKSLFGSSVEDHIPGLIQERDCATLNNPEHLNSAQLTRNLLLCGQEYSIDQISSPITSGPTHQAFQQIVQFDARLAKYPLQLRRSLCDMIKGPIAISSNIILHQGFSTEHDAVKLFILYHELQHHLYNDVAENHLEKIMNLTSANSELQAQLKAVKPSVHNHIVRYVEHRADTKAMESIDCPYCLQEVTMTLHNRNLQTGTFHPQGYACCWQFQPRINELLEQKKCCQHHMDTGKQINQKSIDASTLLNRLKIVQE